MCLYCNKKAKSALVLRAVCCFYLVVLCVECLVEYLLQPNVPIKDNQLNLIYFTVRGTFLLTVYEEGNASQHICPEGHARCPLRNTECKQNSTGAPSAANYQLFLLVNPLGFCCVLI